MNPLDPLETSRKLRSNLTRVRDEIRHAAERAGRDAKAVLLVAVTKYVEPELIRLLHGAGARDFGESTAQRIRQNAEALSDLPDIRWYLVGHLQRNKVPLVLRLAHAVHSLDSERLLREIGSQAARREERVPELFVEVNVGQESQKTGTAVGELRRLLELAREPGILPRSRSGEPARIGGLMAMAPYGRSPEDSRPYFRRLRELRDECVGLGLLPDDAGLSMGMSGDFTVAVEEGATVVRVGSSLFEGVIS